MSCCTWGVDQDFGYRWTLEHEGRVRTLALHLRCDPVAEDAAGILYARERGAAEDAIGVVVHAPVTAARVAALTTVILDDAGVGDLRQLARLLDMVEDPLPATAGL